MLIQLNLIPWWIKGWFCMWIKHLIYKVLTWIYKEYILPSNLWGISAYFVRRNIDEDLISHCSIRNQNTNRFHCFGESNLISLFTSSCIIEYNSISISQVWLFQKNIELLYHFCLFYLCQSNLSFKIFHNISQVPVAHHQIDINKKSNEEINVVKAIRLLWAELGRCGYVSGGGSMHSSPLK